MNNKIKMEKIITKIKECSVMINDIKNDIVRKFIIPITKLNEIKAIEENSKLIMCDDNGIFNINGLPYIPISKEYWFPVNI